MKLVIPLVVFAIFIDVVVCTDLLALEWEYFKVSYNKAYRTDVEHNFRKKIFLQNKKKIDEHNERYEKGEVTYRMGINEFTDMDQEEFNKKVMGGIKWNVTQLSFEENDNVTRFISPANLSVPDVFDWRIKAVVTDVKNQKECGSCWAFSATGALEGHWAIKHGVLASLSEQNLVDCSRGFGNQGCNGGLPSQAFMYIKENKGIDIEQAYPYEGKVGQCRYKKPASVATDKGYVAVEKFNEKALMNAVATMGPVSVAIDASHENFMQYKDGVFYQHNCSPVYLSHAVLVVGYGTTSNGNDYWLVKNSWGTSWGMSGYGLMARNRNNNCGIATVATYPLV